MSVRARSAALAALVVVSCHGGASTDAGELVSTTAAKPSSSATVPSHPASAHSTPTRLCRAMTVTGPVRNVGTMSIPEAGAVKAGDLIGEDYIDLGPASRLSVKNGNTSREAIFEGTGAAKVCVAGEEEMWLPTGLFTSVSGSGEGPGAEQWIVTPHGVVRYDAARVHVVSGVVRAEVVLGSGGAWAFPIDNASLKPEGDAGAGLAPGAREAAAPARNDAGWLAVPLGSTLVLTARRSTAQVVTECEEIAKSARDLAVSITSGGASLTDAAPKHVLLRQKARAVCAVAELMAGRSIEPVERDRLLPRARAASALWRDNGAPP